jgi:hypothetical protein
LWDECCNPDAPQRLSAGDYNVARRRDKAGMDYIMSVQYFSKHVQQRTVVQPGNSLTDANLARALVMLSSVLMASFVVLVVMVMLLWSRRVGSSSRSAKAILAL